MKKIISIILVLIMICCTIPFTAFAAEDTDIEPLRKELEMLETASDVTFGDVLLTRRLTGT